MAVENSYINLASTPGGDGTTNATVGANRAFATAAEGETAKQGMWNGDNLLMHLEGSGWDTTILEINGNTFGSSADYMTWQVDSANRHQGEKSSSYYGISIANGNCCRILDDYVRMYGFQFIKTSSDANYQVGIEVTSISANNYIEIGYCIFEQAGNNAYIEPCIYVADSDINIKFYNNVAYGLGTRDTAGNACLLFGDCNTAELYYNTAHGGKYAYFLITGTFTVQNCRGGNTITACYSNLGTDSGSSHNGSDDTSSIGTNALTSQTWVYTDAANGDYSLQSSDPFIGNGTPVSGITDDIIGNSRDGTSPDGGAFEYVSAVSGNPWNVYAQQ